MARTVEKRKKEMLRRAVFLLLSTAAAAFLLDSPCFSATRVREFDINELKRDAPRVFVDCGRCDIDYIRTEIPYVNYVWDRKEADIHLLVTTERTGGGGTEYTMAFIGQKDFSRIRDTLKYVSQRMDSRDETRKGMVRVIKLGLIPFLVKTPLADFISIIFEEKMMPTAVDDRWDFWIFHVSLNGSFSGEKSRDSASLRGNLSANRVTPHSKLRLGISANFDRSNFRTEEYDISSYSDRKSFGSLYVKSIDEHWSAGAWFSVYSSTYSNIDLAINPAPAVEYNLFPYSQSTRRELRVLYRIGYTFRNYREETIYDKTRESLLGESLSVTFSMQEPWGSMSATLEGSHYFHDFKKNRLELRSNLSLRLFKGFSLGVNSGFSVIHDQLSLPKGEASLDEILLRRTELATSYNYWVSIGFSYTFGSVYSNVVNPRFGS